jgi:hypothetical protein
MPALRTTAFWYLVGGAVFLLAGTRVLVEQYFTTTRGWPDLLSAWFVLAGAVMLAQGWREYRTVQPATPAPLPEPRELPPEPRVVRPAVEEPIPPPSAPGLVRWLVVVLVGLAVVATVVALISG